MKRKAEDVAIKKEFEPPSKKQKLTTKPNKQKRNRAEVDPEIVNNSFINESGQICMYDMIFCIVSSKLYLLH